MAGKVADLVKTLITSSKPTIKVIRQYAAVELIPPSPKDIPAIRAGINKLIHSAKTGAYRNLTVREALLNSLVAIEVYCWFFIGECIGKRHLIGYKV
ncbi:ATP synthase subunit g, mitochondrial [Orussus abietinus]|uniref:ATP synthase subunit g, mitochondrial n=1 Tax=Orussus abietinus TaxID=222816 RepID=UPI00062554A4|nr:ATP synthase subunit g, mitochondrial [Orussus abietinus]